MQTSSILNLLSAFITLIFLFNTSCCKAQSDALLAPISKDHSTNLYTVTVSLKTPLQPTNLHLDLGNSLTWFDCSRRFDSSTSRNVNPNSSICLQMDTGASSTCTTYPRKTCSNDESMISCMYFPENSVTRKLQFRDVLLDSLALLPTTPGGGLTEVTANFVFSCADTALLRGLPVGAIGVAALGRYNYSLPAQVSRALSNSPASLAMCLPSSTTNSSVNSGVLIFNSRGPYYFHGFDVSTSLVYTPLVVNPVSTSAVNYPKPSDDYFIGVTAIKVNGKAVPLNRTLLILNRDDNSFFHGFGGTKISTYTPYTLLQTSIYKALTEAFMKESAAFNFTITQPVKPFGICYAAETVPVTRVGPAVPTIDLVLQNEMVAWRIYGANSMVRVKNDAGGEAWCLGFVDFGDGYNLKQPKAEIAKRRTPIVIGGHQMEDNLVQMDIGRNRLGFSSSLLNRGTSCSNFDFIKN